MNFEVQQHSDLIDTSITTLKDELGNHWTLVATAQGEDILTNPAGQIIPLCYGMNELDELELAVQNAMEQIRTGGL